MVTLVLLPQSALKFLPQGGYVVVERYDAAIIGAGFSGLYMLYSLRRLGLSAKVYEAADGVGGTWYWNRYPGARCDCESMYYSYSFSSELEQEWQWTQRYPEQPEILEYLEHVADRFDLRRDIEFGVRIASIVFDDERIQWTLSAADGPRAIARFVITAVGCLSVPNVPSLPGSRTFVGEEYHTAEWPHDPVDFADKHVGVIGTGSSGIQCIPVIAAHASRLSVFQRTPNFTIPAQNCALDSNFEHRWKQDYALWRQRGRETETGHPYPASTTPALSVDDDVRRATYESLWGAGGFSFLFCSFSDLLTNEDANNTAAEFVRRKIDGIVRNPALAKMLKPVGYPIGAKRIPLDTDYYETFNRPNVTLVDLQRTPLVQIVAEGVRTTEAIHKVDVLVYATGFDAMTGALAAMDIRGRGGRALNDKWSVGPVTYLGLGTAGFPNMFFITGPGSPSVLTNMPVAIEQHVEWITRCIRHMGGARLATIEPTEQAEARWTAHVDQAALETLYPRADSWYMGANIVGKPRRFLPYVGGMKQYRNRCDAVADRGYEGWV